MDSIRNEKKLEIDDEERKMQWLIESFQYFDVFKNSVE